MGMNTMDGDMGFILILVWHQGFFNFVMKTNTMKI